MWLIVGKVILVLHVLANIYLSCGFIFVYGDMATGFIFSLLALAGMILYKEIGRKNEHK